MEIISPKMDFAFRELMEDDEVRRYFICDALNMPVEQVKETRLGNPFLRRRHRKMKLGILDVKVFLQDGTRINLEMQLRRQKFWEKRSYLIIWKKTFPERGSSKNCRSASNCNNRKQRLILNVIQRCTTDRTGKSSLDIMPGR